MIVVRFAISASSADRTTCSLIVSRCEVASSSTRIGASLRKALSVEHEPLRFELNFLVGCREPRREPETD